MMDSVVLRSFSCTLTLSLVFRYYALSDLDHERLVGKIAEKIGFTHISISSSLMPMVLPSIFDLMLRSKSFLVELVPQPTLISLPKSKSTSQDLIKVSKENSVIKRHDKTAEQDVNSCNLMAD